jgi:Predicted metal-binding, possibly nucleic acid-binding protein
MSELWISLNDIPAEGRDFDFTDQSLWTGPMKEFGVAGKIGRPFQASVRITPQDDGFLVFGEFSGSVVLPCVRCAEDFELPLSGRFDSFEQAGAAEDDLEGVARVRVVKGMPEFDIGGYLWEQFLLAMPENPLCAEDCKGLCPKCGVNRNQGLCACAEDKGDPRLAVLRNLKLQ